MHSFAGFLIVLFIALYVFAFVYLQYTKKKMLAHGDFVKRTQDFADYAEIFMVADPTATLRGIALELKEAAENGAFFRQNISFGIKNNILLVRNPNWTAQFFQVEPPAERPDVTMFVFRFTSFTTSYGSPKGAASMNRFLTAVEKALLRRDPNALVRCSLEEMEEQRRSI